MAIKSCIGRLHIPSACTSRKNALLVFVVMVIVSSTCFRSTCWAQAIDPKSPSKEYIRLNGRIVAIENSGEMISTPTIPVGPTSGITGTLYKYTTGGATSSLGNAVQYSFNWGDGTSSSWAPKGVTLSFHQWSKPGTYKVTAQARSLV